MTKGFFVGFIKKSTSKRVPAYRAEPKWDNSRNVAAFNRKMYSINSSMLKTFGTIYSITPVDDGVGGYTFTSTKRADAWMYIKNLKAEQIFDYRGKNVKATHLIKIRYNVIVAKSDHIVLNDITYEVIHVEEDTEGFLFKSILCTTLLI
jgi:SPP1 family predicted phage head-tail adaptor